jgi:hypothetical protein
MSASKENENISTIILSMADEINVVYKESIGIEIFKLFNFREH